uniref:Piwi domain-containing protein n=1 Tax=Panagrolaimus sp. ES5 TaxID=591445 RepID=A0AC34GQ75_9BILA
MANNGAYIIGANTLRLFNVDSIKPSSQWINGELNHSSWTSEKLQERMDEVFKRIHKKLSCLILVNSMQLPTDLLETAYNVSIKYANQVYMISGTFARLQWAITETKLYYLEAGEKAVIVYILNDICQINEIEAVSASVYVLKKVEKCTKYQLHETLRNFINSNKPQSFVLVLSKRDKKENDALRRMIERQYSSLKFHYIMENIDFMMLNGALAKASTIFRGRTSVPMFIQDFSIGFQVEYTNENGTFSEPLIPFNKRVPILHTVTLSKVKSFRVKYNEEIIVPPVMYPSFAKGRLANSTIHESKEVGSVKITAAINTYGVPSLKFEKIVDPLELSNSKNASDNNCMKFIIKLKDNLGSIWVKTDTKEYALLNANHVHKIIGVPITKIKSDRPWHFSIVPADDGIYCGMYGVETHEGPCLFRSEAIMSMFLRALKRLAENHFKMDIHQISIEVASEDYNVEQLPFIKKAALAAGINVEDIKVMNV